MTTPTQPAQTITLARTGRFSVHSPVKAIFSEHPRQIWIALLVTLTLSVFMAGLLPAFSAFWTFAIEGLLGYLPLSVELAHVYDLIPYLSTGQNLAADNSLFHGAGALLWMLLSRLLFKAPYRRVLIGIGALHLINTLVGCALPSAFPYSLADHTKWIALFLVGLILATPLLMLLTHAIIERSLERRILATVLVCAYFILVLPVKLVAEAGLILWLGQAALPTLFLLTGPSLDILLFTTLYAFVVTWRHGNG